MSDIEIKIKLTPLQVKEMYYENIKLKKEICWLNFLIFHSEFILSNSKKRTIGRGFKLFMGMLRDSIDKNT